LHRVLNWYSISDMKYPLCKPFIGLLVLLQLALPLLHAHSGLDNSPGGLHLPNSDVVSIDRVASDYSIAESADRMIPSAGIIVVASSGIRHKAALSDKTWDILFFKTNVQSLSPINTPVICILALIAVFYCCLCWNPSSPRAPPAFPVLT
jgi:hypothetical protein